jgi:hypothetical protein
VLTNYEVLIDDGQGGGFVTAVGGSLNTYLKTTLVIKNSTGVTIVRGQTYRLQYRAQN